MCPFKRNTKSETSVGFNKKRDQKEACANSNGTQSLKSQILNKQRDQKEACANSNVAPNLKSQVEMKPSQAKRSTDSETSGRDEDEMVVEAPPAGPSTVVCTAQKLPRNVAKPTR